MKRLFFLFTFLLSTLIFAQKSDKFMINDYLITFPKAVTVIGQHPDSGAFGFIDHQKSKIQISIRPAHIMEFYQEGLTPNELLEAYYKWDSDHWKKNTINAEVKEIKKNLSENYILWSISSEYLSQKTDNIMLFTIIDNNIVSLSFDNHKIDTNKRIDYLINLYKKRISKVK